MIHIDFEEPDTPEWKAWRVACEQEQNRHNEAVKTGQGSKIKEKLYKKQKHVYISPDGPFHGKCAYCEEYLYSGQHGDTEHYRPKAAVKDEHDKPVMVEIDGQVQAHPGYYWLVYNWLNLLPSCVLCNQRSSQHSEGRLIGKRNQFPVRRFRAVRPGEEVREEPLLLHPVVDYPEKHLELDELGIIRAKTDRGEACKRIFGLNERDLPHRRKERYDDVVMQMGSLAHALIVEPNGAEARKLLAKIARIRQGYGEYAAAARKAIKDSLMNLVPFFQVLLDGE